MDEVVFFDQGRLKCMAIAEQGRLVPNTGGMPLADVAVDPAAAELVSGGPAEGLLEFARDEWLVLMANALVGVGTRSLELGVDYAKERRAFGVPIGSFQAVAHGLADAATAVEGSKLLAREAAWSAAEEPDRASEKMAWPLVRVQARRPHTRRAIAACIITVATASCSNSTSSCTSVAPRGGLRCSGSHRACMPEGPRRGCPHARTDG